MTFLLAYLNVTIQYCCLWFINMHIFMNTLGKGFFKLSSLSNWLNVLNADSGKCMDDMSLNH